MLGTERAGGLMPAYHTCCLVNVCVDHSTYNHILKQWAPAVPPRPKVPAVLSLPMPAAPHFYFQEILMETERLVGGNKGISEKPIRLKIFSPNVL